MCCCHAVVVAVAVAVVVVVCCCLLFVVVATRKANVNAGDGVFAFAFHAATNPQLLSTIGWLLCVVVDYFVSSCS